MSKRQRRAHRELAKLARKADRLVQRARLALAMSYARREAARILGAKATGGAR